MNMAGIGQKGRLERLLISAVYNKIAEQVSAPTGKILIVGAETCSAICLLGIVDRP